MKKLKTLFNSFTTFLHQQEMEAKPKPKEHYLIRRLSKIKTFEKNMLADRNMHKLLQVKRCLTLYDEIMSKRKHLLYAHIENKEVIN